MWVCLVHRGDVSLVTPVCLRSRLKTRHGLLEWADEKWLVSLAILRPTNKTKTFHRICETSPLPPAQFSRGSDGVASCLCAAKERYHTPPRTEQRVWDLCREITPATTTVTGLSLLLLLIACTVAWKTTVWEMRCLRGGSMETPILGMIPKDSME